MMRAAPSVPLAALLCACAAPPSPPSGWAHAATGSTASLRALAAVDADVAYVGGTGGTLLRTTDGGRTWTDVAPPGSGGCDFRDLAAFGPDQVLAMVAGQPARVYRTEDGGVSWRIVHEDPRPQAFFDAMAFAGDVGALFGDPVDGRFTLLLTADAGRTWREAFAEALAPPRAGEVGFAASGTCLAVARGDVPIFSLVTGGGTCRHLLFSVDDGWEAVDLPMARGSASEGAFSIAWRGAVGVAVGGDFQKPKRGRGSAAVTLDGGRTWYPGNTCGYRSAVAWLDEDMLLAVGSHGASYSPDRGRTWQAFGDEGFHSLQVTADGTVWACGSDGRVAKLLRAGDAESTDS